MNKSIVFFSASTLGFYPASMIDEFDPKPSDLVELNIEQAQEFWKVPSPDGKQLGSKNGFPVWVNQPAPTAEQIQSLRRSCYREESDHLKLEAEHDAVLAGTEPDYAEWLAKVAEIKARYPLPI